MVLQMQRGFLPALTDWLRQPVRAQDHTERALNLSWALQYIMAATDMVYTRGGAADDRGESMVGVMNRPVTVVVCSLGSTACQ